MLYHTLPLIAILSLVSPITVAAQNNTTTPPTTSPASTNNTSGPLINVSSNGYQPDTIYGYDATQLDSDADEREAAIWVKNNLFASNTTNNATVSGGGSSSTPVSFPTPGVSHLRLRDTHFHGPAYAKRG